MYTVISSGPSPYARKVRIALAEKSIPFTLQTEVPWDSTTATPTYNPLEKLPVLIPNSSSPADAVYESHYILEWLEAKHPQPPLEGASLEARLRAKQIEVVADGVCDALVLRIWESRREAGKQSGEWTARQTRKVDGGLKAIAAWADEARGGYLVDGTFGLADIAVGSMLGFLTYRDPDDDWTAKYPALKKYRDLLESRESFKGSVPAPFEGGIKDKVV